jgi:periplasmic copper chaperone A
VLRRLGIVGLVMCAVVVVGGPAWAHVSITPDAAPKGSFTVLSFNVPNEEATANTTKVVIVFPTDHPIGDASVEAVPGWTVKVEKTKLDKPIQTDEGEVTEAVSQVTWSGGTIAPESFQQFTIEVGLPDDADSLEFKALQTYDNGTTVRWIEPTPPDGTEPENPAPVLTLTAPEGDHGTTSTTAATSPTTSGTAASKDLAQKDDVDSAKTLGIVGVIVGAVGLLVALGAVALGRRPRPT